MAKATDPDYIHYVIDIMKHEFHRVGIEMLGYNIEQQLQPIHTLHRCAPVEYGNVGIKISIEFMCNDIQFEYFEPLVHRSEAIRQRTPIMPPVTLYGREDIRAFHDLEYEIEIFYKCEMILSATGGSMDDFVKEFRKQTDKLFLAMESKAFDKEVVKLLTEDEYNS